jgi:hypothetical protein
MVNRANVPNFYTTGLLAGFVKPAVNSLGSTYHIQIQRRHEAWHLSGRQLSHTPVQPNRFTPLQIATHTSPVVESYLGTIQRSKCVLFLFSNQNMLSHTFSLTCIHVLSHKL